MGDAGDGRPLWVGVPVRRSRARHQRQRHPFAVRSVGDADVVGAAVVPVPVLSAAVQPGGGPARVVEVTLPRIQSSSWRRRGSPRRVPVSKFSIPRPSARRALVSRGSRPRCRCAATPPRAPRLDVGGEKPELGVLLALQFVEPIAGTGIGQGAGAHTRGESRRDHDEREHPPPRRCRHGRQPTRPAMMSAAGPGRASRNEVPAQRFIPFGSSMAAAACRIGNVIWFTSG